MKALGRHILVELYDCDPEILNSREKIRQILVEAATRAKVTIIDAIFHRFNPHGVSGVIVIAESHLSIHTWPEYKYASLDFFTCGEKTDPWIAQEYVTTELKARTSTCMEVKRGSRIPEFQESQHDSVAVA